MVSSSYISLELSLPVNNDLYEKFKCLQKNHEFDYQKEYLFRNDSWLNSFIQNIMDSNNKDRFKLDLLIPLNYKKGNKTCIFIHGSGSSRLSTRNRFIANNLVDMGICCCLMNLFTMKEEEEDRIKGDTRFNIELLTSRVMSVIDFLLNVNHFYDNNIFIKYLDMKYDMKINEIKFKEYFNYISENKIILFGSSTGAAAALFSGYYRRNAISGIISRGGRPDLVPDFIIQNFPCYQPKSYPNEPIIPVLFIVGSIDYYVAPLNEKTFIELGQNQELKEKENIQINSNRNNYNHDECITDLSEIIIKNNTTGINSNCNSNNESGIKEEISNLNLNFLFKKQWRWIENASHLFEEDGAIEEVLCCTMEWIKNLDQS